MEVRKEFLAPAAVTQVTSGRLSGRMPLRGAGEDTLQQWKQVECRLSGTAEPDATRYQEDRAVREYPVVISDFHDCPVRLQDGVGRPFRRT